MKRRARHSPDLANRAASVPPAARCRREAFTLIEILIVTVILVVVISILGACIAAGIRVLESARSCGAVETRAALCFETLDRDIMNSFPFYAIPFRGERRGASFPGIMESAGDAGELRMGLATVTYGFDSRAGTVWRAREPFPPGAAGESGRRRETVADGVESVTWSYGKALGADGGGSWLSAWTDASNQPARVRVELVFADGDVARACERTVVSALAVKPSEKDGAKAPPPATPRKAGRR